MVFDNQNLHRLEERLTRGFGFAATAAVDRLPVEGQMARLVYVLRIFIQ